MAHELGNGPWDKDYQPCGMSKAEEAAWKKYPYENGMKGLICENSRGIFTQGYEEAEKDLEKEWLEDRGLCFRDGVEEGRALAEKELLPLIHELAESILFDWDNRADVAKKVLTKLQEYKA